MPRPLTRFGTAVAALTLGAVVSACQPTVRVQAPEEPITINLNIRVEQEIRIRVDRDVEALFDEQPDLF